MITYAFARGESIAIPLNAAGDRSDVSGIASDLRYARYQPTGVSDDMPKVASFTVTETEDGWLLTLSPTESQALDAGYYITDARLTIAGGVIITDPIAIKITEPVTEAP